jgi:hypothetical protein
MEVESLAVQKASFSWLKKATSGSYFVALEKPLFEQKLGTNSWIRPK